MALDFLPVCPLELGVTTEDPGFGEDLFHRLLFHRLDTGILKVTVEERRIRKQKVILQTDKCLLVLRASFPGRRKKAVGSLMFVLVVQIMMMNIW